MKIIYFPTIQYHKYIITTDENGYYENDISEILFITDNGFEFPNIKSVQIRNTRGDNSSIRFSTPSGIKNLRGNQGDIVFNLIPTKNSEICWVCVSSGNPGEWKSMNTYNCSSTERPTLTENDCGRLFFDTTLNKPIWWTGEKWVDATGTDVE